MQTLRQMRRNTAGVVILILVPTGLYAWLQTNPGAPSAPIVPTGASFSLGVSRFRSPQSAASTAARIAASGFPTFTRPLDGGAWHQVVVGPYVSIDETERAQARLRAKGSRTAVLVDDSVRTVPHTAAFSLVGSAMQPGGAHLVLVGAGGGLSLVLEMPERPAVVRMPLNEGSLLEVEIGPLSVPAPLQLLSGPEGIDLVNQISVEEIDRDGERFMRAQIALSRPAHGRVRVVDERVYVDFWPLSDSQAVMPANARASAQRTQATVIQ